MEPLPRENQLATWWWIDYTGPRLSWGSTFFSLDKHLPFTLGIDVFLTVLLPKPLSVDLQNTLSFVMIFHSIASNQGAHFKANEVQSLGLCPWHTLFLPWCLSSWGSLFDRITEWLFEDSVIVLKGDNAFQGWGNMDQDVVYTSMYGSVSCIPGFMNLGIKGWTLEYILSWIALVIL